MRTPLSSVPALPLALGLCAGVAAGAWHPVILVCAAVAAAIALGFAGRGWWAAVFIFFAIGVGDRALQQPAQLPEWAEGKKVEVCGTVELANEGSHAARMLLRVDSIGQTPVASFLADITLFSSGELPIPGDRVTLTARLSRPPIPPHIPGDADFSAYRKSEGITASGTCGNGGVRVTAPAGPVRRAIFNARVRLALAIVSAPFSDPCAEFMLAALIGDRRLLPDTTTEAFRAAGISHILALSGLHAGIIVALAMLLTMPLNLLRGGLWARRLIAVAVVWAYAAIAGMGPSVVRAAVMVSIMMAALTAQRGHSVLNSLLLAVAIILAARPFWIYSAGFQLSVCAVAGIVAFNALLPQSIMRRPKARFVVQAVGIPVAAMAGTGLVSAWHFGVFPLLFLPANIVTGLLAGPLIGLGAVVTLGQLCGWSFTALGWVCSLLFSLLDYSAKLISAPGWAVAHVDRFPALVFVFYAIALAAAWLAVRRRSMRLGVTSALALALSAVIFIGFGESKPKAEVYSLTARDGGGLLLAAGDSAWVLPSGNRVDPSAHEEFLRLRTRQDSFATCPTALNHRPLTVQGRAVAIGQTTIYVLDDKPDNMRPAGGVTYLLLGKDYHRSLAADLERLRPDTLLLAPDMHPSRRAAIKRHYGPVLPILDLRTHPLSLKVE